MTINIAVFSLIVGVISILFAIFWLVKIRKSPSGTKEMLEINQAVDIGSRAYLKRQYQVIGLVGFIIFFILFFALGKILALGFLIGALGSAIAGYFGMLNSVKTSVRTAEAAKTSLSQAFKLAFYGGGVTGFLVMGLGLIAVSGFFLLTGNIESLIGLGFGGSLISVFARLGGGIYTKAADVGADLVGKIEKNIHEDDPRNPGVIADNVGDNVGDCAGMAADLFETYVVTLIGAMLVGHLFFESEPIFVFLPLLLAGLAGLASIIGSFFARIGEDSSKIMRGLYYSLFASSAISLILFYFALKFLAIENWFNLFLASLVGISIALLMVFITDYFTSKNFWPVRMIARSSEQGHATNIIAGLSISMLATIFPIILISLGIVASFSLFGLYGVATSAVAMLSMAGLIITLDAFGPITDNAGGISEMAHLSEETRKRTDALDSVGNTTKAVTKGYAIASAGLAALVLFGDYAVSLEKLGGKKILFELNDPLVLIGLFFGAMLPYIFGSLAMLSVSRTAGKIVEEIRRQFREIKGLMEGTAKPDYSRTVDIATKAALREMILPSLLPILITIVAAFVFGPKTLGGILIGVIISGLFLAISMTTGGGAWDNAKKYIEDGNHGGKGLFAHQAAVTGDTVGDPYKDTAGPAINPLIKVINVIALLIVGFLV